MVLRPLSLVLASGFAAIPFAAPTPHPIPFDAAQKYFAEAKALCEADAGKLWGVSLCGPIVFVDPDSRTLVANQLDAQGALTRRGGVYVGLLPKSENFANTATDWSGTHWTEMIWPLPDERSHRDTLMLHELFHRIQDKLPSHPCGTPRMRISTRSTAAIPCCSNTAPSPAPSTRVKTTSAAPPSPTRCSSAPTATTSSKAAADEKALEMNEGLAEYTGVRLGNPQPTEAQTAALRDLSNQAKVPSLVRSFAYPTGPAYGLLLDRYRPDWRTALQSGQTLPELLQSALKVTLPVDLEQATQQQAVRYEASHCTLPNPSGRRSVRPG